MSKAQIFKRHFKNTLMSSLFSSTNRTHRPGVRHVTNPNVLDNSSTQHCVTLMSSCVIGKCNGQRGIVFTEGNQGRQGQRTCLVVDAFVTIVDSIITFPPVVCMVGGISKENTLNNHAKWFGWSRVGAGDRTVSELFIKLFVKISVLIENRFVSISFT